MTRRTRRTLAAVGLSLMGTGAGCLRAAGGSATQGGFVAGGVALLVLGGGLFVYARLSSSGEVDSTASTFEATALEDGPREILTLRAVPRSGPRPQMWIVVVRRIADEWSAYIDQATAMVRDGRSPAGVIEVIFPQDFVGYGDAPAEGWYEATWFEMRTDQAGGVGRIEIASCRFLYQGGGDLLRYATDPRRFGSKA